MNADGGVPPTQRGSEFGWLPAILAAAALAVSVITEAPARLPFPLCVFRTVTGIPCPGCGMTRGFVAMGHGRIVEAWGANPLAPALYVLACGYVAFFTLKQFVPALHRVRLSKGARRTVYAVALTAIAAWWAMTLMCYFAASAAG